MLRQFARFDLCRVHILQHRLNHLQTRIEGLKQVSLCHQGLRVFWCKTWFRQKLSSCCPRSSPIGACLNTCDAWFEVMCLGTVSLLEFWQSGGQAPSSGVRSRPQMARPVAGTWSLLTWWKKGLHNVKVQFHLPEGIFDIVGMCDNIFWWVDYSQIPDSPIEQECSVPVQAVEFCAQ